MQAAAEVARLKALLDAAEEVLDRILAEAGDDDGPAAAHETQLTKRIIAALAARPGQDLDATDVVTAIGVPESKLQTVRSLLSRMTKEGRIEAGERGRYRTKVEPEEDLGDPDVPF